MRNEEYFRLIISKRAAVKAVTEIAEAVLPYGASELSSWGSGSGVYAPNRSDGGVYNLIQKVKEHKRDAEKYHALRNLLKDTVK